MSDSINNQRKCKKEIFTTGQILEIIVVISVLAFMGIMGSWAGDRHDELFQQLQAQGQRIKVIEQQQQQERKSSCMSKEEAAEFYRAWIKEYARHHNILS